MPDKHNAARRHHIPEISFGMANWQEDEDGLKQRGSLTPWITSEVLEQRTAPYRTTPGRQRATRA
ncbi:hypothetical protein WN982_39680 [Paraburkholderia sp. IMGN_8]|uniref:hypothetical protein n=1 Tax=Paraburkholderia sp. IMGN_8 TaxID=3136564 RepID=UPI00310106FC